MSILVNGVDVITPNKLTGTLVSGYDKGIRNTTSKVITGGGTDDLLTVYTGRTGDNPTGFLDIGSSLVSLPIYFGTSQSSATQLKIIKPGETVGLVPRHIISLAVEYPGVSMVNYLTSSQRPDVKKAIYVIQAPGGGGGGSGAWKWNDNDAGGGGGGSGAFAVYMTKSISDNVLIGGFIGGQGGAVGTPASSGENGKSTQILIASNYSYNLTVGGGGGGAANNGIALSSAGGSGGSVSNSIPTAHGELIATYNGQSGGKSGVMGGGSTYSPSSIDDKLNINKYFGMKYGGANIKAIARFYTYTYSYTTAASTTGGTLPTDGISSGGSGAGSLFAPGGAAIRKPTITSGNALRGAGGGGSASRDLPGDRVPGGNGGNGMVAILF